MKCYVGRIRDCFDIHITTHNVFAFDHPDDFAKRLLDHDKRLDVWTNHPAAVDLFKAEDILCVGRDKVERNLTDHPQWEQWKDEMSTGEFWTMVGENWYTK